MSVMKDQDIDFLNFMRDCMNVDEVLTSEQMKIFGLISVSVFNRVFDRDIDPEKGYEYYLENG